MKKLLKKNQIIITALVIMVVIAGYLETARRQNEAANDVIETGGEGLLDLTANDLGTDETAPGEALLVNANTSSSGVFASVKLDREQTRAKNKESLLEIIDNGNITEEQKNEAIASMVELTAISEKENAAETLLAANGYTDVVVSIVEGKADVMVAAKELSLEEAAQIMDMVKRKTDLTAEDIVITPVDPAEV
ncbi:SpoIIIAH-like family protein [Anaerolentibacter hominis]|uniref:SpoIIIAH-like family protein n=1 Tax=Anaerolentibacter hominis TaxID=3079009 RepID=UPI0031B836BE